METKITLRPFDVNEINVDNEIPVASRRVIISKEAALKLGNLTSEKKGSIDENILKSFKGESVVEEPIEVIDAEPVIEQPIIEEAPVAEEPAIFFPQPEQNNVVEQPQNESVVPEIFTAPPVVEQPVVNNEPTEIVEQPQEVVSNGIVDTAVEQPVMNDVEDDEFLFDDTSDQDVYEAAKTM